MPSVPDDLGGALGVAAAWAFFEQSPVSVSIPRSMSTAICAFNFVSSKGPGYCQH